MTIDELDLSIRAFNRLKRAGINTLDDLWAWLDAGDIFTSNMGQKTIAEIFCKAPKMGYPSDEVVAQYIEKSRYDQGHNDSLSFWEELYETLISADPDTQPLRNSTIASLIGMPDYFITLLEKAGIRTVEELFAQHKSEETLPFIFLLAPEFIRILHKNGYRFPECPKEKWPNIDDYILYKRALRFSIDRLDMPLEIREILKTAGITIAIIVNENYTFLSNYLNNAQIAQLLFALDDLDLRPKDSRKNTHPDIVSFVVDNIEITTTDLGLSPQLYSCLHKHSIDTLSQLLQLSRRALIEKKIVSITAIHEIVHALHNYRVHLKGDTFYECTCCKIPIIASESSNDIHYCADCSNRLNRIQQIKDYTVTLYGPDYDSYTDGLDGFTIFATVHNRTNKLVEIKLDEFMLYHSDRQWAPSKNLTGYSFTSEHIMPNSSKTSAKIWSGISWDDQDLSSGDYINFSFSIEGKTYAYKFMLKDDEFEIDDFFVY